MGAVIRHWRPTSFIRSRRGGSTILAMSPDEEQIISHLMGNSAVSFDPREFLLDQFCHYTSAEGAFGIVTSGVLRATNFAFMNDATEITYGVELVREVLSDRIGTVSGPASQSVLKIADRSVDAVSGSLEVYVASFCSEADLLSQWRGYGATSGRFCIIFDAERLYHHPSTLQYRLDRVIYDRNDQKEKVDAIIDRAMEAVRQVADLQAPDYNRLGNAICVTLAEQLIEALAYFKHPGFKEEKEWRAVHHLQGRSAVRFEPIRGTIRPFVELFRGTGAPPLLPIKEVIVGSSPLAKQSRKSVELLLPAFGYPSTSVSESIVPFRDL
jgi:hypothetical protein